MPWTASDIPDLTRRTAVVTGGNGGLGLASAAALAGAGAHVVMAARNQEKARAARDEIRADHPDASLEIVELDLGSLDSVRRAASRIVEAHPAVDVLLNNAGVMAMPERRTEDGFEVQLGVNHLGHWAFTAHLLPALLAAEAPRVVTVTSLMRHLGRSVDPEDVNMEGEYDPWRAYGRSKLANYHFALGLQRMFEGRGLRAASLAAHPGLSNTNLQSHTMEEGAGGRMGALSLRMARRTGMPPGRGALPQLRAATDPAAGGGELYAPRYGSRGPPVRRPVLRRIGLDRAVETLWRVSERATGTALKLDPPA